MYRRESLKLKINSLKNTTTRSLVFLAGDLLMIFASALLTFWILDIVVDGSGLTFPASGWTAFAGASVAAMSWYGLYSINWRFVSLHELVRISKSLLFGMAAFIGLMTILHGTTTYYPVFGVITLVFSLLLVGGFRISKRIFLEVIRRPKNSDGVVIFGAGNAGEQLVRDVQRNNQWEMNIEAIFDDKVTLWGTSIHNVPILGGRRKLYEYLTINPDVELIVGAPSIPKKELKKIINRVKSIQPKLTIKVVPSLHKLGDEPVSVKNIRDIRIEDILGREPAEIDFSEIETGITGKTILVTGAGGSIGSEIVRQLLKFNPRQLIALDIDETELFHLENELKAELLSGIIIPCVADVTDKYKLENVFREYDPDLVYHAAAYKHVPMMERYPEEAVRVNIGGTRLIAELACQYETEKFILISSDKAVNPANVMGATKRISEQICMAYNDMCETAFISVRFGNVLGSRGSVLPLFIEQIENGGPVTITDPEITRYFMTIPEAVLLVLQSGAMGGGGEVFVLDMGEPVKILDMAHQLIRLHGLEPETDIQITYDGLRPGEKLYEELLNAEEGVTRTNHPSIMKADCNRACSNDQLSFELNRLIKSARHARHEEIKDALKRLVPTYTHDNEMTVL